MRARRRRVSAVAGFALLALVAELAGRELTDVVDRALHVVAARDAEHAVLPVPARRA